MNYLQFLNSLNPEQRDFFDQVIALTDDITMRFGEEIDYALNENNEDKEAWAHDIELVEQYEALKHV